MEAREALPALAFRALHPRSHAQAAAGERPAPAPGGPRVRPAGGADGARGRGSKPPGAGSQGLAAHDRRGDQPARAHLGAAQEPGGRHRRRALHRQRAGPRVQLRRPGGGARGPGRARRAAADALPGAIPIPTRRTHNLPARLNHAIGRSAITRTLGERLATRRLVSIVGPGGMGKTTVALAVAESQLDRYPDGVWFVDLAPLTDPARVPRALASALQISVSAEDPWATLRDPLRDSRMLIVLDNCEHVIEAAASLVERVLREAPAVHILATSREALEAEGEWVHRLAALEAPVPEDPTNLEQGLAYPAVRLFVERASANSTTLSSSPRQTSRLSPTCAVS